MTTEFVNDPARSIYRLDIDGKTAAFIEYTHEDGVIDLLHTIVTPAFRGQGLGGTIVQHALDDIRANSKDRLVVHCSFAKAWLEEHPEYEDLTRR